MRMLLIVKSSMAASALSQHLHSVDACSFGMSLMGGAWDVVVVVDPIDEPSQREWLDNAIRTRLLPGGYILENVSEAQIGSHPPQRPDVVPAYLDPQRAPAADPLGLAHAPANVILDPPGEVAPEEVIEEPSRGVPPMEVPGEEDGLVR